ncbi:hypothetical protein VTK56DRAFT_3321 [Thermocarpiscus australiensis]
MYPVQYLHSKLSPLLVLLCYSFLVLVLRSVTVFRTRRDTLAKIGDSTETRRLRICDRHLQPEVALWAAQHRLTPERFRSVIPVGVYFPSPVAELDWQLDPSPYQRFVLPAATRHTPLLARIPLKPDVVSLLAGQRLFKTTIPPPKGRVLFWNLFPLAAGLILPPLLCGSLLPQSLQNGLGSFCSSLLYLA